MTQTIHSGLLKFLSGLEHLNSVLSHKFIDFIPYVYLFSFQNRLVLISCMKLTYLKNESKLKKVTMQLIHRKCLFYFIPNI